MTAAVILAVSQSVVTGLFGLGGVLVGGVVAGGADLYFHRRRESGEERQARRLIAEELRTTWIHASGVMDFGKWPNQIEGFLPTERWHEYGPTLALRLPDSTWDALSPFMDSIASTRRLIGQEVAGGATTNNPALIKDVCNCRDLASELYVLLTGQEPDGG